MMADGRLREQQCPQALGLSTQLREVGALRPVVQDNVDVEDGRIASRDVGLGRVVLLATRLRPAPASKTRVLGWRRELSGTGERLDERGERILISRGLVVVLERVD